MSAQEAKMAVLESRIDNMRLILADHEIRTRSIERTIWMAFGASTLFNILLACLMVYVTYKPHPS